MRPINQSCQWRSISTQTENKCQTKEITLLLEIIRYQTADGTFVFKRPEVLFT